MCIYAKKHDDGKTYCYAPIYGSYPISDSYGKYPYMEEWCEGKMFYRCGDYLQASPWGNLLFSIFLGLILWVVAFPFIILEGIGNPLLWNLVSLICIIGTFFGYLQIKAIRKELSSIIQSKEEV